jgi:hypothetical protein
MLRLAAALCLAALCALAALPAAQAQAGANDPKVSVSLEVSPKAPTIPLGSSQTFLVNVKLSTQNVFCNAQGTMTVKLDLKDTGLPGVTGALAATVDVPIHANVNPPTVTTTSGGNNTARLVVTVASSASPDHDHGFTVLATTPATVPTGCQALSNVPPPAATATADVALKTGPAAMPTGTGGVSVTAGQCSANVSAPGVSVSAAGSCPTTKKSFFVPMPLQVAVLLAVGLLGRRRA